MPKRTNEFQQLVLLLQSQLSDSGRVTESAFLVDRLTGGKVEVDVLVTSSTAQGIDLVLGFECTAGKRAATVEWVREMIAKHSTLSIDKTVLVSKSGFSDEATKWAEAHNALPVALEEAVDADWLAFVRGLSDLRLGSFQFTAQGGTLDLVGPPVGDLDLSTPIRIASRGVETTLEAYINALLSRPDLGNDVLRLWLSKPPDDRKRQFDLTITGEPQEVSEAQVHAGDWRTITRFTVKVRVVIDSAPLTLEPGSLHGHQVAFGTAPNIFRHHNAGPQNVLVNLLGTGGNISKAGLLFPGSSSTDPEIHEMKILRDPGEGSA